MTEITMEKIVALAKNRGFVYPGSEIYGGLANTWDYGPIGVELKNNVKKAWWRKFIQESPYNVGVDCAILMNPQTWVASGHVGGFSDPLMDCKECKARFRADKIVEDHMTANGAEVASADGWTNEQLKEYADHLFTEADLQARIWYPYRNFAYLNMQGNPKDIHIPSNKGFHT